jgi:hypothetical protein
MEEMIIDIEHEYPFALTVDSVDNLARKKQGKIFH